MEYIQFSTGEKMFSMSAKNLYEMKPVKKVSNDLKEMMKKSQTELIVELFLKDSSTRPHSEIAKDLKISTQKVKMMRYQFKAENRTPYEKRLKILTSFYMPDILK